MIKKISELETLEKINNNDILPIVDMQNNKTKKVLLSKLLSGLIPQNAGAHNSIYRGQNITDLFYDGTLSEQIAAGTFDDIFVGDYIIGKNSNRKYLVADIDYRLHCGDTECTTHHVLMIPEKTMGVAKMNESNTTAGAYMGSKMYSTNLSSFKEIIKNDFTIEHILTHRNYLKNAVTAGYESGREWVDSDIELMTETMVCGSEIFHNIVNGTSMPTSHTVDKTQLSLFRMAKDKIIAFNDSGTREIYWLRDVVDSETFAVIADGGYAANGNATHSRGVRPAFLIF